MKNMIPTMVSCSFMACLASQTKNEDLTYSLFVFTVGVFAICSAILFSRGK